LIDKTRSFEAMMLAYLDSAYNLARWLLRDEQNAQDVVQEAYLRAFQYFDSFHGGDARPWILGIVRNACFSWLARNRQADQALVFDEERDIGISDAKSPVAAGSPEQSLMRKLEKARIDQAIGSLSPAFREVIILREMEDLSYEQIAQVAGIPVGTVMSRLARARALLRRALAEPDEEKQK